MRSPSLLRSLLVLVPAAVLIALGMRGVFDALSSRRAVELPRIHRVPAFAFSERSGRKLGLDELRGRVWIADFVFTHCAGTCPAMFSQMRSLQDALGAEGKEVLLVSFTVDPERDTPERLSEFARTLGASESWLFLRAGREEAAKLSRQGFLLGGISPGASPASVEPPVEPGTEPIAHDRHFALVDRQGWIRGYYDGTDPGVVEPLRRAALALLLEPAAAP